MFEGLGRALYRRRRLVLAIAVIFVVFAGVWGTGVFSKLISGNTFTPPGSQSQREASLAAQAFGRSDADVVVLYRSATMTVDDPAYRQAVASALAALPAADITRVTTYWSSGSPGLVSSDRHATYAAVQLAGSGDSGRESAYKKIKGTFNVTSATSPLGRAGISAQVGGQVPAEVAINSEVSANIARAEMISIPLLVILLMIIFGSFVSAALPAAIGGIAILGSFTVLRLLTLGTQVSVYSINVTTIIGLGLGIDYGLFMVTRFREELRRQTLLSLGGTNGASPLQSPDPTPEMVAAAVARTVATAGRTVAVSGITVAVALCSLMLFPEVFLRSMGYGGVATVLVDMIAALTVLPALLAVLGHRVNSLRVRRGVGQAGRGDGGWDRLARSVMRRPVIYAAVIVVGLLALGAPFLKISWGGTDARALPATSTVRQVQEALNSDFRANSTAPIEAVVTGATSPAALSSYIARVDGINGVAGATVTGKAGDNVRLDIAGRPRPDSTAARQIVADIRAVPAPPGVTVLVGGDAASLADELSSLGATLPWMAVLTGCATFILLFLAFGSVVLPVKAIVMNVLSLSATFGVIVWVFQWGHLSGLLQFTPTGTIDPTMPILLLAIVFGLSMDYEVFLLSRVRELYDETGDTTAAVAGGLQRTGGLITSLALLLIVVVGLFSASGIVFIKLLGVGMIVALVVDAAVVRTLLVPATMRLLGRANWWAPGPLRRLYARYGIKEAEKPAPASRRERWRGSPARARPLPGGHGRHHERHRGHGRRYSSRKPLDQGEQL
jgi:trehalose monomycolate/heme transporter